MEYSLTIDLLTLSEWKDIELRDDEKKKLIHAPIDPTDCFLATLIDKYESTQRAGLLFNDFNMVWIDHSWILKQVPLLRIKRRWLRHRLKKLEMFGLIKCQTLTKYRYGKNAQRKSFYQMSGLYRDVQAWARELIGIMHDRSLTSEQMTEKMERHLHKRPVIEIRRKTEDDNQGGVRQDTA